MKLKKYLLAAAVVPFLTVTGCASASNQAKEETMKVEITNNQTDVIGEVIYSQITGMRSNRALRMSLLIPRTADKKPAVVYFPGGGFTEAVHDKFIEMRMALARAGFIVAAVEYRVVPDRFPALLNDAKSAVRYLRAHADQFGLDKDRIGVLGDSAGGYLSQMTAVTGDERKYDVGEYLDESSEVQACATIYGISNLLNIGEGFDPEIVRVHDTPAVTEALLVHGPAFGTFPGATITSDKDKALEASSISHLDKKLPPFLIMHGTADKLVSPVQSEQLYQELKKRGAAVDYVKIEGAGHGDITWFQEPVLNRVVSFFKETLHPAAPKPPVKAKTAL